MEFEIGMQSKMYVMRLKSTGMIRIDSLSWWRRVAISSLLKSFGPRVTWAECKANGWECVQCNVAHTHPGSVWIKIIDKTVKDLQ